MAEIGLRSRPSLAETPLDCAAGSVLFPQARAALGCMRLVQRSPSIWTDRRESSIMPIGLLALSLSAFAIGTSEFIIAGVLPNISAEFGTSIPTTGLLVTGYAFAVAIGGPVLAMFTARARRKPLILVLLGVFALSQAFCAAAPSYSWLMAGRIFSACSHGLFFGAGSVVAVELSPPRRRGMAMALFLGGITVANLFGVPLGTAIGNSFGWRWTFCAVGLCGVAACVLVAQVLPNSEKQEEHAGSVAAEVRAVGRQQVYLSYLVIALVMIGNLAFATYQVPAMISVSHVAQQHAPILLTISGVGAIIGIYAGGRAGDWKLMPTVLTILLAQAGAGGLLILAMPQPFTMAVGMFVTSVSCWALNAPIQSRILAAARSAPHLAATLISTAYNVGIGVGAWFGALWIGQGLGYRNLPVVGIVCSLLAALVAAISWVLDHRAPSPRAAATQTVEEISTRDMPCGQ